VGWVGAWNQRDQPLLITLDMCEWLPEDDLVFRLCCLGGPGRDTANDPGPDTATDEQRNSACLTAPAVPSRSVMSEANSLKNARGADGRIGRLSRGGQYPAG
jgi:hypothetical protein